MIALIPVVISSILYIPYRFFSITFCIIFNAYSGYENIYLYSDNSNVLCMNLL